MLCSGVIYIVLVIVAKVPPSAARPLENDEASVLDNRLEEAVPNSGEFIYKIPSVITDGFMMTIQGTINENDKTFTAVLPSTSGGDDCKIVYDFAKQTLDVMPASASDHEPIEYTMDLSSGATFSLSLKARTANGNQIFDLTFEGNAHMKNGRSDPIACKIKSFTDINLIIMKEGVLSVKSLLFEFPK